MTYYAVYTRSTPRQWWVMQLLTLDEAHAHAQASRLRDRAHTYGYPNAEAVVNARQDTQFPVNRRPQELFALSIGGIP